MNVFFKLIKLIGLGWGGQGQQMVLLTAW